MFIKINALIVFSHENAVNVKNTFSVGIGKH